MTTMLGVKYVIPSWTDSSQSANPGSLGDPFNVVVIGAGNVNFGSDEGPWNHSYRLEQKIGPRLKIVALVDPVFERAADVLQKKRASFVESAYRDTVMYKTIHEFASAMKPDQKPKLILIGCPSAYRGSDEPGRDLEIQVMKLFPNSALFVEKPVASFEVSRAFAVANAINQSGVTCSVGYMLRYLKAVQMMKKIIRDNQLTVMATIARYACAYEAIVKPLWWDKELSGGPVIEQGTHFCDLSRYFGGDVDIPTVQAHSVQWNEAPGKLSRIGVDESKIPAENRIPRVTSANWKYKTGATGSLTHLVALQGTAYSCELEVYCDGYLLKLIDPYNEPILQVRRPGSDKDEIYTFKEDDPFLSEISAITDVIEKGQGAAEILSNFEDACKTYELTWAIRLASEKTHQTYNK
ncbi:hypothetical protein FRC14_003823 [Serendipita sp. 396]|nr:hypothetical protein FRC14_003823 [Serendipita sp. 396]KAG8867097.1 hypothetical protein FRC20_006713 [Serendipita sp. 405]